jgi:four helix bundle protein
MTDSAIQIKSKAFALRIIRLYKFLTDEKREFVLSRQLLRSGTSIGANVRESRRGQSKPDFYSKLNIALKEADESAYWLELLHESQFIDDKQFESVYADCNEVISLLVAITKTQKGANSNGQ